MAATNADALFLADLRAWQLILPPGAVFTHVTAARLRGWALPPLAELVPVFVALPAGTPGPRRPGLVVSRLDRAADHRAVAVADGLYTDTTVEVLLRAARDLGVLDLLVLLDAALRCDEVDGEEMSRALASPRPGTRVLRQAWLLGDGRAESPWESILRAFHVVMEVPVEPQAQLLDDAGRLVARADLLVQGSRLVQEYDGAGHRAGAQHARDLQRERALLSLGYQRRGYTRTDLVETPAAAMLDLDRALGRPRRIARLRRWSRLIEDSVHSQRGRSRLANRWRRWGPPADCADTA